MRQFRVSITRLFESSAELKDRRWWIDEDKPSVERKAN